MYGSPPRLRHDCYSPFLDLHDMTRKRAHPYVRACPSSCSIQSRLTNNIWDIPVRGVSPLYMNPLRRDHRSPYFLRNRIDEVDYSDRLDDSAVDLESAVAELYYALTFADRELRRICTAFDRQTSALTQWLPSRHIDFLWEAYLSWDGIPLNSAHLRTMLRSNAENAVTFDEIARRLAETTHAIEHRAHDVAGELPYRGPRTPNSGRGLRSSLPYHRARATEHSSRDLDHDRAPVQRLLNMLDVIENLLIVVREQREKMELLIRAVVAAKQLLKDTRDVWDTPRGRHRSRTEKRAAFLKRDFPRYASTTDEGYVFMDL